MRGELTLLPGPNVLDVMLQAEALVSGTVVDESGRPLVDVSLSLECRTPVETVLSPDSVTTDDQGHFLFKGVMRGDYTVTMQHPDFLATELPVTAPADGLRWVMRSGMSLDVELLDEGGHPVPGATVLAHGIGPESSTQMAETTGEEGKVLLKGLEPGRYMVAAVVAVPGHLRTVRRTVESPHTGPLRVRLQLTPGLRLEGLVVDREGKPLEQAVIRVAPLALADGDSDASPSPPEEDPTRDLHQVEWSDGLGDPLWTGKDGRFALDGLAPGTYFLRALKPGYVFREGTQEVMAEQGLRVSAGARDVRVVLDFMGVMRGRVVRADGSPVIDFSLNDSIYHGDEGRFSEPIHEPGEQELVVNAEGLTGLRRTVRVREGEDLDVGDVVLQEGREVRVRVLDARTSQPLADADVDLLGVTPDEPDGERSRLGARHRAQGGHPLRVPGGQGGPAPRGHAGARARGGAALDAGGEPLGLRDGARAARGHAARGARASAPGPLASSVPHPRAPLLRGAAGSLGGALRHGREVRARPYPFTGDLRTGGRVPPMGPPRPRTSSPRGWALS